MRILITGGFGFIGGRLAVHLEREGHTIVLGSRKKTCNPDWLKSAEVRLTNWDDYASLSNICKGIDLVIHAAGMNAQECAADPVAALNFNGFATARLVEAAKSVGIEKFIYLSTAHVYTSQLGGLITEDTCTRNLHPYATSHIAGENAVLAADQKREIQGVVLRLSNAYGAPVQKDINCWMLLINDLCRQAVETHKMILKTSGQQQRDFVPMAKVCRIISELIQVNGEIQFSGVINIGSGIARTIFEMASLTQDRFYQIHGDVINIEKPDVHEYLQIEQLEYRSNRLKYILKKIELEENIEIDNLIQFCRNSF
jgi:UDP-glucose 4-epimerase